MLAYGSSDSPRSSGDGPASFGIQAHGGELVPLSLAAGNVVKLKGLPFKGASERDVARFFAAFRFASADPSASIFLRRHPDGRLTGEVSEW
jgi:hypothetical protein